MTQGYTLATFPKVAQYILCTTREETGKRTLHNWWRTQKMSGKTQKSTKKQDQQGF